MTTLTATQTIETSLVYLMKNYADYNFWANLTLVKWLKTKPEEKLQQEVASSFPSIQLTLQHIWQTQDYWLSILKGQGELFDDKSDMSVKETLDGIVNQSNELAEFVESISEKYLQKDTLIVSQWFECNYPNFEYIQHVMNHSTYHRGQIVTIGRILGFTDAPMTDYNFYNVRAK